MRVCRLLVSLVLLTGIGLLFAERSVGMTFREPRDLQRSLDNADLVIRGRVLDVSRQTYDDGSGSSTLCGTNYSVDVFETYKGESQSRISFSAYSDALPLPLREAQVGDEMLLLLRFHSRPFDPFHLEVPDVVLGEPSTAKQECINRLSRYSLSDFGEVAFLLERMREPGSSVESVWLTYMRTQTLMPNRPDMRYRPYDESCRGAECDDDPRLRTLWPPLEQQIREWTTPPQ
jgi:hypothetical protein